MALRINWNTNPLLIQLFLILFLFIYKFLLKFLLKKKKNIIKNKTKKSRLIKILLKDIHMFNHQLTFYYLLELLL